MKIRFIKKRVAVLLSLALLAVTALGSGCGKDNSESDLSLAEKEPETGFTESQEKISVSLVTDKDSYEEGEIVHYTLTISNENPDYSISGKKFSYTNKGLVPASEGSMPDIFDTIRTGDTVTLSGELIGGNAGNPGNSASLSGDGKTVSFRPYVEIKYAGEEAMVRCVLNLKMTMLVRQFGENAKNNKTACCHDPSIFKDTDGTYYIFGTHISCSSTTDLFDWTERNDEFKSALSQETRDKIRQWNDDSGDWWGNLWAPDIIYSKEMGKYLIYLSANGDNWKSNIVLLTADNVMGPYEYAGSIVYGGFDESNYKETDVEKVLGEGELPERYITNGVANKKWGDKFPNCIDPCAFYDDDGNLWMTYGSWSGGIFMLKLDKETGLRDYSVSYETDKHSDAYFGKLIAGGCYVSGEGSYIQKIGDYYYLFISYGALEAKGGYNIRVFRSKTPDGPYEDELGHTPFYDSYSLNINHPVGERLFGGYRWKSMSEGQVAQGHNSAFVDDDGKAYIVFHTRTTSGNEGHFVKVHQLFVNEDGWLVAAPFLTDGETLDENGLDKSQITGDYEIIFHRLDINFAKYEVNEVEHISLLEDGTVSGDYQGTWSVKEGKPYINLDIDGDTFSGVALTMEIEGSSLETTVFTCLGKNTQVTLWGSRMVE
ncbi:glycoside hydrolase family 43 protein [Butyrivibrio sp. YAB3001]|uniref:glycoside hydrolase family 43 protein n=1 Tax=Butyrivibrio sp. YAB3001 TaxID=1520812 RepID=UPI0008F6470F|nr:glycoside hydrolase family 43 protein [Butyrivibrio sp. YAB3001]SFB74836.1 arabinan endo-1,5-alpha-L-arabinosidase [Butyrivibrio sp. YAB3001]